MRNCDLCNKESTSQPVLFCFRNACKLKDLCERCNLIHKSNHAIIESCIKNNVERLRASARIGDKDWQEPAIGAYGLIFAVENGSNDCVSFLMSIGANPDLRMSTGWSALLIAAQEGQSECIRIIASSGRANIDIQLENSGQSTAILIACRNGHVQALLALLDAGADPSIVNAYGQGPAHVASQFGYVDCLQILIARGADYKSADNNNMTPMDHAIMLERADCVGVLLARNVECSILDCSDVIKLTTEVCMRWMDGFPFF